MPTLDNYRHQKFVQEIFSGKNATEAYRAVYGEKKTAEVTSAVAARLLGIAKVHARLRELQAEAAEKNQITVESMIKSGKPCRSPATKKGWVPLEPSNREDVFLVAPS
jgi:hypothetical protein